MEKSDNNWEHLSEDGSKIPVKNGLAPEEGESPTNGSALKLHLVGVRPSKLGGVRPLR